MSEAVKLLEEVRKSDDIQFISKAYWKMLQLYREDRGLFPQYYETNVLYGRLLEKKLETLPTNSMYGMHVFRIDIYYMSSLLKFESKILNNTLSVDEKNTVLVSIRNVFYPSILGVSEKKMLKKFDIIEAWLQNRWTKKMKRTQERMRNKNMAERLRFFAWKGLTVTEKDAGGNKVQWPVPFDVAHMIANFIEGNC